MVRIFRMDKTTSPRDRKECVTYILTYVQRIAHELIDTGEISASVFLDVLKATVLLQHTSEPEDKLLGQFENMKGSFDTTSDMVKEYH